MDKTMGQILTWKAKEKNVFTRAQGKKVREKELVLASDCRKIEDEALMNNVKIKRVQIPSSVTEVGKQSFANCTALNELCFDNIERIKQEAFSCCIRVRKAEFSKKLQYIGKGAFFRCKKLETATFPESVTCVYLAEEVFYGCESLKEIKIPKSVQEIKSRAFYKCLNLEKVEFPLALRKIGSQAFYQTALKELELLDGLREIGDSAFLKCNNLESVKIPESVKRIGKWAFHGCHRLKVVEIAHEPEFIGDWIVNKSTVIRCRKDSKVEAYCKKFEFAVEYIE